MKASEKKFQNILQELEKYPHFQHKRSAIEGLKEICDAIADGRARQIYVQYFGKNKHFSGKINSNTVSQINSVMGHIGPSRSTLNRNPELMKYIELREKERTEPSQTPISSPPTKQAIDRALNSIESMEDQQLLRFAIHEGDTARRELRLLKQQLQNYPSLKLTLDELSGASSPYNSANIGSHITCQDAQDLVSLVKRLEDERELQRFLLVNVDGRVKEASPPGKTLVTRKELEALKKLATKY